MIGTSIRAFNNAGTQLWSTDLSDHGVSTVYYVATGTLDGLNPSPHFVVAAAPGRVVAVDKNGNVLWSWATSDPCYSVLLEDVNADGLGEVVVGSGNHGTENPAGGSWYGYVYVLDNLGSPPVLATFETPSSVKALAYGDADNDGNDEIIASCDDGNVYIIDVSTTC